MNSWSFFVLGLSATLALVPIGCGGGENSISLSGAGLEFEQELVEPGGRLTAAGSLLAIANPETSVFERVNGAWNETDFALEPDGRDVHVLAINGDTLLVGRVSDDGEASVDFMERRGLLWEPVFQVASFGIRAGALDGDRVVLAGDGVRSGSDGAVVRGLVRVFEREGSTWREVGAAQTSPDIEESLTEFGRLGGVALHGDVIVVGDEPREQAFVFEYVDDPLAPREREWRQTAVLEAPLVLPGARFGHAVSVSEELIAVSAYSRFTPGGVFVFERGGPTGWEGEALVEASNADIIELGEAEAQSFGASIALRDGLLLVGAPEENSKAQGVNDPLLGGADVRPRTSRGAVYLFERVQGNLGPNHRVWNQRNHVKVPGASLFGSSVTLDESRIWVAGESTTYVWRYDQTPDQG